MNQEKIGTFIKNLRKKNNLTQQDLASILGVTYQAVSKWENGTADPSTSNLISLAKLYEIDPEELIKSVTKEDNN